jgi:exo-beta-1,3-glucanase (GH17 family)
MPKNRQLPVITSLHKAVKEQAKLTNALEKVQKANDKKKAEKIIAQIKYADQIIAGLNNQLKSAYNRDKKEILDMFNL